MIEPLAQRGQPSSFQLGSGWLAANARNCFNLHPKPGKWEPARFGSGNGSSWRARPCEGSRKIPGGPQPRAASRGDGQSCPQRLAPGIHGSRGAQDPKIHLVESCRWGLHGVGKEKVAKEGGKRNPAASGRPLSASFLNDLGAGRKAPRSKGTVPAAAPRAPPGRCARRGGRQA